MTEIDKFASVRDYEIPQTDIVYRSVTNINVAVVYCIWDQPLYLKLVYMSLFSQFAFTDVDKTSVFVFVDENLFDRAVEELGNFPVQIIKSKKSFNKYTITTHPLIKQFDYVSVCDCDTFFYCATHRFPLYKTLLDNPKPVVLMSDPDKAIKVFFDRKELSPLFSNLGDDIYEFCWSRILGQPVRDLIPDCDWHLSCLAWFDTSLFNAGWEQHISKSWNQTQTWCDETVFLTYFWQQNIPIHDFDNLENVSVHRTQEALDFVDNPTDLVLGILHPLHGDFCNSVDSQRIFNTVLTASYEFGANIQDASDEHILIPDSSRSEIYQLEGVLTKVCHLSNCRDFFSNFDELKSITGDSCFVELIEKVSDNAYSMKHAHHDCMFHQLESTYLKSKAIYEAMKIQLSLIKKGWFHSSLHQVGNILIRDGKAVVCDLDSLKRTDRHPRWYLIDIQRIVKLFSETANLGYIPECSSVKDFEDFINSRIIKSHYQSYVYNGMIVQGNHDTMRLKGHCLELIDFQGKTVVDVGSAEGCGSLHAIENGANEVWAVDTNEESLAVLRKFHNEKLNIICDNWDVIVGRDFDVCLCFSCVHLADNPIVFLHNVSSHCNTLLIELELHDNDAVVDNHEFVELSLKYKFYGGGRVCWSVGRNAFLSLMDRFFENVTHIGKNTNGREVYLCSKS